LSRRLRLVEGERREAGRVPDALIRRVRGAMIEVEGISKSFGATRALAGVDMSVPGGDRAGPDWRQWRHRALHPGEGPVAGALLDWILTVIAAHQRSWHVPSGGR
jgi:hypothetical protein